jgi:hypothetical protein
MVFFVGIAPHKEARTQQTLRKYALARGTFEPQLYEEKTEGWGLKQDRHGDLIWTKSRTYF